MPKHGDKKNETEPQNKIHRRKRNYTDKTTLCSTNAMRVNCVDWFI